MALNHPKARDVARWQGPPNLPLTATPAAALAPGQGPAGPVGPQGQSVTVRSGLNVPSAPHQPVVLHNCVISAPVTIGGEAIALREEVERLRGQVERLSDALELVLARLGEDPPL
jgi:hypothetical protein